MLFILITLFFLRPFISSLAFPYLDFIYSHILLGCLLIWFVRTYPHLISNSNPGNILYKSIKYPLLLFILSLIISISFSAHKINSLREIYKYITAILIFCFAISLPEKNKAQLIRAFVLAAFIVSILAIYQYFFGFQHLMDYVNKEKIFNPFVLDYISRERVYLPFVTPNILAGYLILIFPLCVIIKKKVKWIILPTMLLALLLTKSLGALLSLYLGAGAYLYLRNDLPKKKFAFLAIISIFFIFIFILRQGQVTQHTLPAFSIAARMSYWHDTAKIINAHPFAGIGMGNFNLEQTRYAHNSYLQIWAELGMLGFFSFLWLIVIVFKSALIKLEAPLAHRRQIIPLITACIIFLIHNFVDFTFFLPEVSTIWWAILGLTEYQLPFSGTGK